MDYSNQNNLDLIIKNKTTSEGIIHLNFGAKAVKLAGKELEEIQKQQNFASEGAIRLINGFNILPYNYIALEDRLLEYEYRKTDTFILGFPKTGTTFIQEIVWTIMHNLDNDNPKQENFLPFDRVPFFDHTVMEKPNGEWDDAMRSRLSYYLNCDPKMSYPDMLKILPDPRVYKCHFTANMVNPKMLENSKIVYTIRNPFDSFLSYYYYSKTYYSNFFNGDLSDFLNSYINERFMHGSAPAHCKGWWPYKNHKNFHFIYYEDVLKSPATEIKKLAAFLEKDLTDKQLNHIMEVTSFKNMQKHVSKVELDEIGLTFCNREQILKSGGFFRKGESGKSKEVLSKEMYASLSEYFKREFEGIEMPYKF